MDDILHFIKESIKAAAAKGAVIDVDRYCTLLKPACPNHTRRQLQAIVLEMVAECAGYAVWGESSFMDNRSMEDATADGNST